MKENDVKTRLVGAEYQRFLDSLAPTSDQTCSAHKRIGGRLCGVGRTAKSDNR